MTYSIIIHPTLRTVLPSQAISSARSLAGAVGSVVGAVVGSVVGAAVGIVVGIVVGVCVGSSAIGYVVTTVGSAVFPELLQPVIARETTQSIANSKHGRLFVIIIHSPFFIKNIIIIIYDNVNY